METLLKTQTHLSDIYAQVDKTKVINRDRFSTNIGPYLENQIQTNLFINHSQELFHNNFVIHGISI